MSSNDPVEIKDPDGIEKLERQINGLIELHNEVENKVE
jgi:hypothetical protein